jgi:5,10-methylenetetrahydromethanopterin reductase
MAIQFCLHGSARSVQEAVDRAERAEAVGFEAIFFADSHMNNVDPYQVMAMCALKTKKIRFGTAVTNMVYRDPTITANSFATLNEISGGRAIAVWVLVTGRSTVSDEQRRSWSNSRKGCGSFAICCMTEASKFPRPGSAPQAAALH